MAPSVVIALLVLSLLCVAWLMILNVLRPSEPGKVERQTAMKLGRAKFASGQKLTEELVKDSLTGNLCRCTGYEAIINAGMAMDIERFKPFAESL
jgi:NADH:ubiquinone oxidoreductase subunit 3 (subunit A)